MRLSCFAASSKFYAQICIFCILSGIYSGFILQTAGTFVFYDRTVSSPDADADTSLSHLLMQALAYHQPIDSMFFVPFILEHVHQEPLDSYVQHLRRLRALCVGGANVSEEVFGWLQSNQITIINLYGLTEMCGVAATRGHRDVDGSELSNGLMGVLVKDQAEDEEGEMVILSKVRVFSLNV
jgi:acyl-coenzyme A synthetase/AMP-(fatty) acid ligase